MKILATVDGSDLSHAVLTLLSTFSDDIRAEVKLLTVQDPPQGSTGTLRPAAVGGENVGADAALSASGPVAGETHGQALARAKTEGTEYLEALAGQLRKSGFTVETEVIINDNPADVIIETARRDGVGLIAMATHGRSGFSRLRHGSVAEAVLTSGVGPVLLVRPSDSS